MPVSDGTVQTDTGLHCPRCDYNLTGIASARCPECGTPLDWSVLRQAAAVEQGRRGPVWERWPWWLLPVAFVVTALEAAVLPWRFAARLPARPRVRPALGFLLTCAAVGVAVAWARERILASDVVMWLTGVAACVLLEALVFTLLLPLPRVRWPLQFWLAVACYTSYPLVAEGWWGSPPYIINDGSNIWPLHRTQWTSYDPVASVAFYVWGAGLLVMALTRIAPRQRWRALLLPGLVPLLTYVSSYAGCYVGEHADDWLRTLGG